MVTQQILVLLFYVRVVVGKCHMGAYQSGQLGQTVNLLAYAFYGSNPYAPTIFGDRWVRQALKTEVKMSGHEFDSRYLHQRGYSSAG